MIDDPVFYLLAVPAVIMLGFAKGGFAGAGALSMPILSLFLNPVQAAAILLPILLVQDLVGVWAFRRTIDSHVLGWMLPGALVGIWLGYRFAASVTPGAVMGMVGAISVAFGGFRLWQTHSGPPTPHASPGWVGTLFGAFAGFTSQIAHAGGPPFQFWVLPRGLPRDVLVGTTATFFAVVNWVKVPAYWALGEFTAGNLVTSAALMPVAIISTLAGVWLIRRISADRLYVAIYLLMILVGLKLVWDALG